MLTIARKFTRSALTATRRPHAPNRRPWLAAAGGAALVVAVAVATWQNAAHRERMGSTVSASGPAAVASRPATTRTDTVTATHAVYVVGSADEAARLHDTIAAGNEILNQFGTPPFTASVLVAASAAEEAALQQATADVDAYRAAMGLPPLPVIVLRGKG